MAISRFKTSTVTQGLPKYQKFWDQITVPSIPVTSGLRMWYDASDTSTITQSGGRVSAITNKASGYTHTLTQATSGKQPAFTANGRNGLSILQFSNSRVDSLNNTASTPMNNTTSVSIFFAGKTTSTANGYKFSFGTNNGSGGFPLIYQLNNKNYFETGSGTNPVTGTSDYNGVANIQFVQATGATGGTIQKTVTSTTETNTNSGQNFTASPGPTYWTGIGEGAGSPTDYDFYEIAVYNRTLTTDEYNSVVAYLKAKWGI